ncbi:unnamed protein product [Chilo suppressalis]|uniref:Uncharacterized protein n=1 Tax=Chilo suppressalis TaxID=168631 RepID=A0ABN8BAT8_CHISP|nr:unnamed protein product [Chilo suppressalis]
MWCWRRMERISLTEKLSNERILDIVGERKALIDTLENRYLRMFGHLVRHDEFIKNIIEGKVEGKRGWGRPRIAYTKQIKEKVGIESCRGLKELAEDRGRWRRIHRQHRQEHNS